MNVTKINGLDGRPRDYIEYPKAIPPYPHSELIIGLKADRYRYHCGEGDMWPLTWGADGNIYAAAGDNKGSPLNFWRISQYGSWDKSDRADPAKLTNTNDWTIDLVDNLPLNPAIFCKHPNAPGIKPAGLLDVGGVLYLSVEANNYGDRPLFNRQHNYHGWIVTTTDYGETWNREATPTDFFTGRLSSCHFLQFGSGYEGARDGYVYAYFPFDEDGGSYWENGDGLLLGRVPADRILDRASWQFYAASEGSAPRWSTDDREALPVFSYYKMTGEDHVCYNAGLGRYLLGNYSFIDQELRPRPIHQMSWPEAYRSQLTLFEAPEPWGPWRLFHQDDGWGTYGDYQPAFPTKWISRDGRMLFMVSSGSWDDYNFTVQKLALKLRGDVDFPPESRHFDYR